MKRTGKNKKNKGFSFRWFLCVSLLLGVGVGGHVFAAGSGKTRTVVPIFCDGWENPNGATSFSAKQSSSFAAFHERDAAVFRFRPSSAGRIGEASSDVALTCDHFLPKKLSARDVIVESSVVLSLAWLAQENATATLSVATSLDDGVTWTTIKTEALFDEQSNATRGGYLHLPLPLGVTQEDLRSLRVRLAVESNDSFGGVTVYADAVTLEVKTTTTKKERRPFFSLFQEPVFVVDDSSIDGYELLDADGTPVSAKPVLEVVGGKTRVSFRQGAGLRPGTYILRTKSKKFFRSEIKEQEFSFGLATVNTSRAVFEPGDLVPISIGVLNERGKTVCDAKLSLRIIRPDGTSSLLSTTDGSLAGSTECGPESITNQPDYSANIIANEQGVYRLALDIGTDQGTEHVEKRFEVQPSLVPDFSIERRAPTRINPKADYVTELHVVPSKSYDGTVTETLPAGFSLHNISEGGTVSERDGKPVITWNVAWQKEEQAVLSYAFDAPDISPALYTIEPLVIGSYAEPREWTIASDELVREEKPDLPYESIALTDKDLNVDQPEVAAATKPIFDSDENAHVKVYKEGYEFPVEEVPDNLDAKKPLTVKSVEVVAPDGNPDTTLHVSEEFKKGEKNVEFLHLIPQRKFTPGEWRIDTTVTDGKETAIISETFTWGVLVLNTRKSVYRPGEEVQFAMGGVDVDGNTVCDASMSLVITPPDGSAPTVLSSDAGTIHFSEECGPITITNMPDYDATFTPTVVGEYKLTLAALVGPEPYVINETVTVAADATPFIITRTSIPARVYPLGEYDITLTVRPITDFKGTFEELIPATYGLVTIDQDGKSEKKDDQTTAIHWNVDWKAGTDNQLTYRLDPEDVSPALFTIGPASVGGFTELRTWKIASDIISVAAVDASASAQQENVHGDGRKLVFTDDVTGYLFYLDGTGSLSYSKSTNAGMTWGSAVLQTAQADCENFSIWYDQWTPGGTGTLIHVAFLENGGDDVIYDSMDTSGDVQRAAGEVIAVTTSATTHTGITDSVSITRATDGDLYIASSSSVDTAVVRYSTDTGSNWSTTAAEGLDDSVADQVILMPQPAGDILMLRWDISAEDIQSKEYEDGGNAWDGAWTDVDQNAADSTTYTEAWSATLNPATWEVYLAYVDQAGTTGSSVTDVRTSTYSGTAWTAGTDVYTNYDTIVGVTTVLDTITGEIYIGYVRGIAAGPTVVQAYYKISTDGMTTWGYEKGPVINYSGAINGIAGNFASPYRASLWIFDDTYSDVWFGDMADIGAHAAALLTTNFNGFESQDSVDANATAGTFSYSTGVFRSGAAALRTNPSNATGYVEHTLSYAATGADGLTNFDNFSSLVALRVASGTTISGQSIIYSVNDGTTTVAEVSINADQTLSLTTGTDVNGTFALVDDTWYVIAVTYGIDFDVLEVGIYSTDMATLHEDLQQTVSSTRTVDRIRIGSQTASRTADLYFDDWMVYANDITANFPLLRADYRVSLMNLDAVGTDTDWTNDYTTIDEIPTSSADYIETLSVTTAETSNIESASSAGVSGNVLGVRVLNTVWESSSLTSSVQTIRVRGAGIDMTTALNIGATAGTDYVKIYTTQPTVTTLWTTATIDSLEVGVYNATAEATTNRNGANVTQVAFVPANTITVSGTCDDFNESTDCTDDGSNAIKVAVDGVVQAQTDTVVDGSWSIASVPKPSRGQVVTVFIDANADVDEAVAVTRYDGTGDITGVTLFQEHLTLGSVDDQTIRNYDIARYDNSSSADEDVFVDVDVNAGNILTVDSTSQSSTEELYTLSGDVYRSYGNVNTHDFEMNGNVTMNTFSWTVTGSWAKTAGTFAGGTSTVTFTGTSETITGGAATVFNNLTINPASAGTITITSSNPQVNGLLTVASSDTLTVNSSLTLQTNTAATFSIDGTISGAGTLDVRSSNLDADSGTLSSIVRFTAQSSPIVAPARTYGGLVEFINTLLSDREIQLGAGSPVFSANVDIIQTGGNKLTLNGATNDPTVSITGNLDNTGTLNVLTTGSNNWTVSGNVDLTDLTYTTEGAHTLIMNGTTKTLTSAGNTLNNVTLSGSITLANATHTIAGDFSMAGGTITAGSSTVTMTGTKNLVGGSQTLNNLTVDGTNTTVSLITSDLTVSGTLTIGGAADSNNDTLDIAASRTVTSPAGATVTFVASGTDSITGAGTLTIKNANLDTDGTLSSVVRFDTTNSNVVSIPQRTFGGVVEVYTNDASTNRTVDLGTATSQTITFSSDLNLIAANNNNVTLGGATYNPTVNVTGNIDFTGAGSGTEILSAGGGVWTVSGNVNLSDGTYTTATNNEFKMTGTGGKTLTANGNHSIYKFTADPSSADTINVSAGSSTITVSNTLTVASGDALAINAGTVKWTGSTMTITSGTISGAGTLTIDSATTIPTNGTISATTRFDVSAGSTAVVPQRTFNGQVEVYSNSATARSVTLGTAGSQTITLTGASSNFYVIADGASPGDVTVTAAVNDPAVTIGGSLDFTGSGSSTEVITTGAGTWSVAANANLTDGTWTTEAGSRLKMNGTGTLTTDNETLLDLEINSSSTVTLAAAAHTVSGDLILAGSGTPTVTSSTITMTGTAKAITGGGKTLNNLTIDPSTSTITLNNGGDTYDLTVSGTLNVASGDTLSLAASSILAHTGATLTLSGTISGAGEFDYWSATAFPTTGTISSTLYFITDNNNQTVSERAGGYGGLVGFYNSSTTNRTVTLGTAGSQTITITGGFDVWTDGTGTLNVTGVTNTPAVSIGGAVTYTGSGGTRTITTGAGAWSVAGNITATGGTFTPTSGNTVTLNGAAKQTITSASQSFYNLTLTNTSGSFTGCGSPMTTPSIDFADATSVTNNFNILTQNVKVEYEPSVNHVFQNINWNGVATDGIVFRSESAAAWNLDINGTQTDVSYVSVAYSDATLTAGGVNAANGTNTNCLNNTNWTFPVTDALIFTISDTTIGFGTVTTAAAVWATGNTAGSASDVAAHTMGITATGTNGGYVITYNGALLTNAGATIDAASITNDADGTAGTEQFGLGFSTDGNATITAAYDHNATPGSRDWAFIAGSPQTVVSESGATALETISAFYLMNVAGTTEPGTYATDLTFIATGSF